MDDDPKKVISSWSVKLDMKHRATFRKPMFRNYSATQYEDGTIVFSPRISIDPNDISEDTLRVIQQGMENLKQGTVESFDMERFKLIGEKK